MGATPGAKTAALPAGFWRREAQPFACLRRAEDSVRRWRSDSPAGSTRRRLQARHRAALDAVGVADETELTLALRDGKRTMGESSVADAVWQAVAARLMIANPGYAA
jgi:hypothetical protein